MLSNEQGVHILIVDDVPRNIQILGTILMGAGYQVHIAENGYQALELAQAIIPNLILLDVMMPELDGFSTCEQLKAIPETQAIPVIFLTARVESDDIVQGFKLGAVDYVTKPFNASELLARVHSHLALQRTQNEMRTLVHVLCHDLVTPLGAVVSLLSLLEPESLPETIHESLLSAAQNGLDMIHLVRELQALKEAALPGSRVILIDMVQQTVKLLSQRFKDKQLQLDIQVPEHLEVCLEPRSFVNSVLNNLLTNAIKFSWAGGRILIHAEQQGDEILLLIQDEGIGIEPEQLAHLFHLGQSKSHPGTQGEQGTGFGMPLVKRFVEAYGGKIEITSQHIADVDKPAGTKVCLRLRS